VAQKISRFDQSAFRLAGFVKLRLARVGHGIAQNQKFPVFVMNKGIFQEVAEGFIQSVAPPFFQIRA
jgi:hypothetical protein